MAHLHASYLLFEKKFGCYKSFTHPSDFYLPVIGSLDGATSLRR